MALDHTDDVGMQMQKMLAAANEIKRLTDEELIPRGNEYNNSRGKYKEVQAKIAVQKEIVNCCKISIKAEGSHL